MKSTTRLGLLAASGFFALSGLGMGAPQIDDDRLTTDATSPDRDVAQAAWKQLRAEGAVGMEHLRAKYASQIESYKPGGIGAFLLSMRGTPTQADSNWLKICQAMDAVGDQYHNVNGLFWYTDLEQAEAAAKAEHKPILSLRLLGNLNEPLTCANSRFFRMTLYANSAVSQMLKDQFILHWQSVRPVPVVTVNFGDGHTLVRTLTGNSIHYVLSPNGELVDALPGLYDPTTFMSELLKVAPVAAAPNSDHFAEYRKQSEARLVQLWNQELVAAKPGINTDFIDYNREQLLQKTSDEAWSAIAHRYPVNFDVSTIYMIGTTSKFPGAQEAARLTTSKMMVENPLLKAIQNLEKSTSVDTVKNNLAMRTQILEISLTTYPVNLPSQKMALDQFNDEVYSKVFLTPSNDPFFGLESPDTVSGIDNDGEQVSSAH